MKFICIFILAFFALSKSFGQTVDSTKKIDFIEIGLFTHSISLPPKASNRIIALNRTPGITIGAGISIWKEREKLNTKYFMSFSAYHQKELHYGFELSNAILAQYRLISRIYLEGGIGIGYLHTFEDAPVYKNKGGEYKQVRDWGRPQITTNASLGIKVALSEKIDIVSNYKLLLQLPFARKSGILFIPHSRFTLGARINLNKP